MPSNFTANYNLSQWERTDKIQMEDFNTDNAKIDGAIKTEADARTAADAAINAALAKLGNCEIWTTNYMGSGGCGPENLTRIDLPAKPVLLLILDSGSSFTLVHPDAQQTIYCDNGGYIRDCFASWSNGGRRVSLNATTTQVQMSSSGKRYFVIALIAKS